MVDCRLRTARNGWLVEKCVRNRALTGSSPTFHAPGHRLQPFFEDLSGKLFQSVAFGRKLDGGRLLG